MYSSTYNEKTVTKRSKGWRKAHEKMVAKCEKLSLLPVEDSRPCLAVVGDYVYLPYTHMNHIDGKGRIPFESNSGAFLSTKDSFIPLELFTPEVIWNIITFRPRSMMGGEITGYRTTQVPRFIYHLKYLLPELFSKVRETHPVLSGIVDKIEGCAMLDAVPLRYLPPNVVGNITIGDANNIGFVDSWDGTTLKIYKLPVDRTLSLLFRAFEVRKDRPMTLSCEPDVNRTYVTVSGQKLMYDLLDKYPEFLKFEPAVLKDALGDMVFLDL